MLPCNEGLNLALHWRLFNRPHTLFSTAYRHTQLASGKEKEKQLYALAESQAGLFTAKQAQDLGYHRSVLGYHVKNGDWVRVLARYLQAHKLPIGTQYQFRHLVSLVNGPHR